MGQKTPKLIVSVNIPGPFNAVFDEKLNGGQVISYKPIWV